MNPVQKKLVVGLALFSIGVFGIVEFMLGTHTPLDLVLYLISIGVFLMGFVVTFKAINQKRKDGKTLWGIFRVTLRGLTKWFMVPTISFFVTIADWMERDDSEPSEK